MVSEAREGVSLGAGEGEASICRLRQILVAVRPLKRVRAELGRRELLPYLTIKALHSLLYLVHDASQLQGSKTALSLAL